MRSRYVKGWFGASVVALGAFAAPAAAQQIPLTEGSVIGGSGAWQNGAFNAGQFNAGNVADFQTGDILEPDQAENDANGGFWLGREQTPNENFVLDLGQGYQIGTIELYNTHNAQFNDRGTADFTIDASNDPAFGTFTTIASGTLNQTFMADDPIDAQTVASTDTATAYRYLRFTANTFVPPVGGFGGAGLNEIRVFQVPEPASLGMLGAAALGLLARRRR